MSQKALFTFAVFTLLFINSGDLHQHLCLDGQEPAVSYHFENLDGHPEHADDEKAHNDYESEIAVEVVKYKNGSFDQTFFLPPLSGLVTELSQRLLFISIPADNFSKFEVVTTLPPQRAPPRLG